MYDFRVHDFRMYDFRWAKASDYDALGKIMFDAVRSGPSAYSKAQNQAWMPEPRCGANWNSRLNQQDIFIAETAGESVGFMSLIREPNPNGYVDFAYIVPNHQGCGLFRQLYDVIEKRAKTQNQPFLWTHARLSAKRAFEAVGFDRIESETVMISNESLLRFKMQKTL